jgi:hypothetical protein
MQPNPFATIASPTGSLTERVNRVNRGSSGITGLMVGDTPFLTNRPDAADAVPLEAARAAVAGRLDTGSTDPRALLRALIEANDTTGREAALERDIQPLLAQEAMRQRVAGSAGQFARDQRHLDTVAAARTQGDPTVARMERIDKASALNQLLAKAAPAAEADRFGAILKAESDRYTADQNLLGAMIRSLSGAYADTTTAGAQSGLKSGAQAREDAAVLRDVLLRLFQGQANAAQQ